jgi:hypothetical protein
MWTAGPPAGEFPQVFLNAFPVGSSDLADGTINKLIGSYHEKLCALVPSVHKEYPLEQLIEDNTLLFIGYWCVYMVFTVANLEAYKDPTRKEATRQMEMLLRRCNASLKASGCLEALKRYLQIS